MSTRVTTTILLILLVLISAASGIYHFKNRQEVEALKQRITELTRERSQPAAQPTTPDAVIVHPVTETPLSQPVRASDADTSVRDEGNADSLSAIVLAGDVEALRSLIESGADLTGVYADGQNLLHLAAQSGNADVAALLIEAGLDVSSVDDKGRTPLHLAAESGQASTAQMLIELGANLEATDASGRTPLSTAVQHENSNMVEALVGAGANTGVSGAFGQSLLHTAAYKGDTASVTALLAGGIDAGAVDARGRTALHYADAEVVPLLVEAGLDVNQPDSDGNTPILNAMSGGEVERAGMLYAAGADASVLLPEKDTYLIRSARYGLTDLGGYLLNNGANVNAGAESGMTALDIAVKYEQEAMAALLIQYGGTNGP